MCDELLGEYLHVWVDKISRTVSTKIPLTMEVVVTSSSQVLAMREAYLWLRTISSERIVSLHHIRSCSSNARLSVARRKTVSATMKRGIALLSVVLNHIAVKQMWRRRHATLWNGNRNHVTIRAFLTTMLARDEQIR